jgi:predicted HicB family RNase H-like nuclease
MTNSDTLTSGQTLYYKGFKGNIKVCFYRNMLFGHVQGIEDVVMYIGKTPEELLADFSRVVDSYLKISYFVPK